MRNKAILLGANTDDKVHYICDKLCGDLFYTFNLGGKQVDIYSNDVIIQLQLKT